MKTEVKFKKNVATANGISNQSWRSGGELNKSRPKFEGETVDLGGVCFDCYDGNHSNNYFQVMRKVADYFSWAAKYGTYIQYTIMKESPKVISRPVKVDTDDE